MTYLNRPHKVRFAVVLGLVSNVWGVQLSAGADLFDLISIAASQNLQVFELRQKYLGSYESSTDHLPDVDSIALKTAYFSGLKFIAAYEVPFLNPETTSSHPNFSAATKLACAVATDQQPHIRIVDLETTNKELSAWAVTEVSATIVALVRNISKYNGLLSVENAVQSWGFLQSAITLARDELGKDSHRLRVCFDPANLAGMKTTVELSKIMESLKPEEVGMLHLKQRRCGILDCEFREGDIDWRPLLSIAVQRGLLGQALFEIAGHDQLWLNLASSSRYFEKLLPQI